METDEERARRKFRYKDTSPEEVISDSLRIKNLEQVVVKLSNRISQLEKIPSNITFG